MNRRTLFRLALGTAGLIVTPAPLRKYFIIGQPERRWHTHVITPEGSLSGALATFGSDPTLYRLVDVTEVLRFCDLPTAAEWARATAEPARLLSAAIDTDFAARYRA